ncbi:MAG: glutathione S-transferase family protein [Magnetococcales bacterium]|nr:glutathione S-transferase family protein [Magnetococcales bacterium]
MEPELFLFDFCPYCQRVSIVVAHLSIAHQAIQLGGGERPSWFGEVSPQKTVPALRIGSQSMFDSSVITEYLNDSVQGGMLPADPVERGVCRSWIGHAGQCQGLFTRLCQATGQGGFETVRKELIDALERIELGPLTQGCHGFNGRALSLVDVAMAPLFTRIAHVENWQAILPTIGLERVRSWSERLLAEPVVAASIPDNFPILFQRFLKNKAADGHLAERLGVAGS